jgi:hypothetical protein
MTGCRGDIMKYIIFNEKKQMLKHCYVDSLDLNDEYIKICPASEQEFVLFRHYLSSSGKMYYHKSDVIDELDRFRSFYERILYVGYTINHE